MDAHDHQSIGSNFEMATIQGHKKSPCPLLLVHTLQIAITTERRTIQIQGEVAVEIATQRGGTRQQGIQFMCVFHWTIIVHCILGVKSQPLSLHAALELNEGFISAMGRWSPKVFVVMVLLRV